MRLIGWMISFAAVCSLMAASYFIIKDRELARTLYFAGILGALLGVPLATARVPSDQQNG